MYYSNFTKIILLAAEQSIPRIKHKKIREQSGNPWWNKFCKQAVSQKREKFKKWILTLLEVCVAGPPVPLVDGEAFMGDADVLPGDLGGW